MKLAVVELLDRDGHARQAVAVEAWPITIGRAVDCDIVVDDAHVAARHVTLWESEGALTIEVGESINGAEWQGARLPSGGRATLPAAAIVQIGSTRLRVRRASDPLAPERVLTPEPPAGRVPLSAVGTALVAWAVASQWIDSDPGARVTDYLPAVLGTVLGLVVWCGLWALASKLFRNRFEFWPHTRIATSYLLGVSVIAFLLPVLAFSSGWPALSKIAGLAGGAVSCAMVVAHLSRIVPGRRRAMAAVMCVLYVLGVVVLLTRNYQINDRYFGELYVTRLAPPALRLAPAVDPARFLDESKALKAILDAHAKDDDTAGGDGMFDDE
jgi:hypothetical protein